MVTSDLNDLVARARRLAARPGRSVLGLVGAPGAGKSTLAAQLVAALGDLTALVPMDGYHLAGAELVRLGRAERKGAPDTFDAAGYAALLRRLHCAAGPERGEREPVYAPVFDRHLEEAIAGAIPVGPDVPLVITEGNYLLLDTPPWHGVRELLDEVWFVELDDDVRVRRLVARHVAHGRSPEAALEWVLRSDEANARIVAATRSRADLVVRL